MMRIAPRLAVALALSFASVVATAQAPDDHYRTLRTAHFNVHFPADIETVARRAAGSAERAYEALSPLLPAPQSRIDLVVTDHVDFSNGFAYVSPSPRIVVHARPPVDDRTLRFRDDWFDLVIQHELVHVFHMERTRGWWRLPRAVFGRQPLLFPNAWVPSWMLEGLAVYYESKLGAGGRLEGMAHEQYVTADALDGAVPRLGQLSSASLDYPNGTSAYIYGAFLMQSLAGRAPGGVERFVEQSSGRLNPFAFNRDARLAFGVSLSAQWAHWRDSVMQAVATLPPSTSTPLTTPRWYVRYPRVAADGRILYVAANGRDATGLYELPADGSAPRRIARRNTQEPNVALADGRIVFAQSDYTDLWRYRSDLWVREVNGDEHALTHGQRLSAPDARARDGAIIAVQTVPGSTRLVRVGADGTVTPLTTAPIDTTWSAPRWSHDGTRIAATRWEEGGTMSIVVLDTLGRVAKVVTSARATIDQPAWSRADDKILFSVNTNGTSTIWMADLHTAALRYSRAIPTALDQPDVIADSTFVAVETRGSGLRLVRGDPLRHWAGTRTGVPDDNDDARPLPAVTPATGVVEAYRPLRQLVPRYWLPEVSQTDENKLSYGATVTSFDIIGRHFYAATLAREPQRGENTGALLYRYAGFGLPLADLAYRQTWDHTPLINKTKGPIGTLARRRRFMGASLTLARQRLRQSALLAAGAELELRDFVTDPVPLINQLGSPLFLKTFKYPTFTLQAGWGNTRTPILAISPEDGVSLSGSVRTRWRTDDASRTRSTTWTGVANLYKAVPFIPGSAHHVIALRGAAALADDRTNTELEAGGVSGSSVELAPGLVVGDVRRNFFVRGFAPGAQRGIRALGGSAEWRAPIVTPDWGTGLVPFFLQRMSATVFADAAAAWCPAGAAEGIGCPTGPTPRQWISSAGAELVMDAAVLNYDVPYRLRLGVARPMLGRTYASSPSGSVFFSFGAAF